MLCFVWIRTQMPELFESILEESDVLERVLRLTETAG